MRICQNNYLAVCLDATARIFFYTDGLIEAEALDGEVVNYHRLEENLPDFFRENPKASEMRVREWHKALVKPGPQVDDITILVAHFG